MSPMVAAMLAITNAIAAEEPGAATAERSAPSTLAVENGGKPGVQSDADEARRLRELLLRFQRSGGDSGSIGGVTPDSPDAMPMSEEEARLAAALDRPFGADKVLLRATDVPLAVREIEARLGNPAMDERRNNAPLIGAVQTRRRGTLVASTTHSMAHVGKYHFVAQVSLVAGNSLISAADQRWNVELPGDGPPRAYILTLYAPPIGAWELHALPADALAQTRDTLPAWLAREIAANPPAP